MWTSSSAGGAMTSDLPTFSLSPQEYITKVHVTKIVVVVVVVYVVVMVIIMLIDNDNNNNVDEKRL